MMKQTRMKRFLAAFLAAAALLPAGQVNALAEEEVPAAVEETPAEETAGEEALDAGETISVEEEEEEFNASVEEVRTYLEPLGEVDGYEVYLRPKDYKDSIEAKIQASVKDEDEAKDQIKDTEKHLKKVELALVDAETEKMAAELEEIGKSKTELIYFSEAGNFIVFLDKETNAVNRIRYRVSTLDSEYLFLTKDKETLEYYSTDYEEIRAEMKRVYQHPANGEWLYRSDDESYFALLGEEGEQVKYCVKYACENDTLRLYYDEDTAMIGLENKENGYIWWSSPIGCNRDTRATKLLVTDLQSSAVLTYGDSSTRGVSNLRSRNAADLKIKENKDGITVTYDFDKCGVTIPIEYTLEDGYLRASVDTTAIKETKAEQGMVTTQLTMLGSFGAAGSDEDGYFVIPDGCGSLIRFNNGKETSKSYSAPVYGRDLTMSPTSKPPVTETVLMPVYGIVREDGNAMTVIADEGDAIATLRASVSGQSLSSYNLCSWNFQLRGSDTFYMAGDYGNLTVFEPGEIKQKEIGVRYYPTFREDASYVDIADTYRQYLLDDGRVSVKATEDSSAMALSFYGGAMKKRSILGFPVNRKTAMTTFSEAQEIVQQLEDAGVSDMVVTYHQWTNQGISRQVDDTAKPAGVLGGQSDFKALTKFLAEKDIEFYPAVHNVTFSNGNGYYSFFDTAIRISNAYSRQYPYTLSYGVQDTNQKARSLLSPGVFQELYQKLGGRYVSQGLNGISLGELTSALWGDYGKQNMGRGDTETTLQSCCEDLANQELSLYADPCAAYAFPYADRIGQAPLQSSGFDVFDEDIPFYQLVLHGVIPYSGTPINASADSDQTFLTCIAYGCDPAYDMIYAQASDLKDTNLDSYFYSHYAFWIDTAASEYQLSQEILSGVSDQMIVDFTLADHTSVTTYADGTVIEVDYDAKTIQANGKTYDLVKLRKGE